MNNINTMESGFPISESSTVAEGEIRLWKAVINQAFCDMRIDSDAKKEYKVFRRNAVTWLTGNTEDFKEVCYNADLDPVRVRNAALRLLDKLSKNLNR